MISAWLEAYPLITGVAMVAVTFGISAVLTMISPDRSSFPRALYLAEQEKRAAANADPIADAMLLVISKKGA